MAKAKFERTKPHVNIGTIGPLTTANHAYCGYHQGAGHAGSAEGHIHCI